jgi:hypothetical protein
VSIATGNDTQRHVNNDTSKIVVKIARELFSEAMLIGMGIFCPNSGILMNVPLQSIWMKQTNDFYHILVEFNDVAEMSEVSNAVKCQSAAIVAD